MSDKIGIRIPLKTFRVDTSAYGITLSGNVIGLIMIGTGETIGATLAARQRKSETVHISVHKLPQNMV